MINEVFRDFMIYVLDQYYDEDNLSLLKEYVDHHKPEAEKRQVLLDNMFWWQIFYEARKILRKAIFPNIYQITYIS